MLTVTGAKWSLVVQWKLCARKERLAQAYVISGSWILVGHRSGAGTLTLVTLESSHFKCYSGNKSSFARWWEINLCYDLFVQIGIWLWWIGNNCQTTKQWLRRLRRIGRTCCQAATFCWQQAHRHSDAGIDVILFFLFWSPRSTTLFLCFVLSAVRQ